MAFLDELRAALEGRGLRLALLFGSQARGTAGPGSDVDVAMLAPGMDLLGLASDLSRQLGREVDVVDLGRASIPLLEELPRDAVVVWEEPGEAALWRSRTLCMLETDRPWLKRMQDAWLARVARQGVG